MNNITQSVQRAIHAYLFDVEQTVLDFLPLGRIYTSLLSETALVPNVLIKCQQATCTNSQDGNWQARARIELREAKDDTTEETHFDDAGKLFSLFATTTVAEDISGLAVDPFTAQQVTRLQQGWMIDGRLWVSYLEIELECCTSDFS